ncbi:MAG TPA: acyltransferase, partial [Ilumatobacteraceae bacterium]|nr:acyltransferase [Ilumatobacteraceae bacterium]
MTLSVAAAPLQESPADQRRPHLAALDGLRGLAVIAVLLFHGGKLQGGFLGVDLFFALSGFLITSLLLAEIERSGTVDVLAFWGRRLRRLLPAVLLLLVGVTIITTIVASVPERAATLNDGPWAQAYVANWHAIAGHRDYWASFELPRMFGHLWSLAIEEQFYFVWPVLLALIAWRSREVHRTVMSVCIVASLLSLAQMIRLFDAGNPTRVYIGTDTRASSLLLGALFAVAPLRAAANRFTARVGNGYNVFAVATIAAIGVSWAVADGPGSPWLFRGGLFAHSLLSALIVAGSAAQPNAAISRLIGWEPLRITGVLSYSLYLWHWPLYALLSESRTGMSGWGLFTVRVAASFAAAALSKVLVEDPVRFRAQWARGRAGLIALIAVTVAVAMFWVVVPHPNTKPAEFSIDQLTSTTLAPSTTTPVTPTTTEAAVVSPLPTAVAPTTTIAATTTTTTLMAPIERVIMTGDSLAFDEWPGVAAAMYASKIAIGSYVSPGAGLLDTKYPSLAEIEKAITDFHPDLVLYQGSLWDFGTPEQQRAAYEQFTDFVLGTGARLGFITIPPLRADQHNDQLTPLTGLMNDIAASHPGKVFVLDSAGAWGPVFALDVNGDKIPERKPDGAHVCPSGSAMYAIWLTGELQKRFAGFEPAPASVWATGAWVDDPRYTNP